MVKYRHHEPLIRGRLGESIRRVLSLKAFLFRRKKMNDIELKQNNLPMNIEELQKYVLFSEEKFKNISLQIKSIDKLGLSKDVYNAKLNEAQKVGAQVLEAKVKIGELLDENNHRGGKSDRSAKGGTSNPLPRGIDKKQSHQYQELYRHQDLVEQEINEAEENEDLPTTRNILKKIKELKKEQDIENIQEKINNENKIIIDKYDVVILDPPWAYGRKYDAESSRVASPYPEQSKEEIYETCKNFFKDNSILWLWTTHQFIWQAKELLEMWGFEYKATLVWDKEDIGMGNWLRMQCEFCLLAVKGDTKGLIENTTERDIIREKKREHSRKPEVFYNLVKKICYGTIFEYYSREKKENIITAGVENDKMAR